jgi:hypothetical protein
LGDLSGAIEIASKVLIGDGLPERLEYLTIHRGPLIDNWLIDDRSCPFS